MVGLYLEAKGLCSEVATLMVDETKQQLKGTGPVNRHPYLRMQENESQRQSKGPKDQVGIGKRVVKEEQMGKNKIKCRTSERVVRLKREKFKEGGNEGGYEVMINDELRKS